VFGLYPAGVATGATGPPGPPGAIGGIGATGIIGHAGPQGAPGSIGGTGATGIGATGATGPQGPRGAGGGGGGAGPPGATGATGPAGSGGIGDGATGATGATGIAGMPGTPGTDGAAGPAGPQGATGIAGTDGAVGPQGATGPIGLTGGAGAAGPQGATGLSGAAGPQGATGLSGSVGPQGATGLPGSVGPQGATGPPGPYVGQCYLSFSSPNLVLMPFNGNQLMIFTGSASISRTVPDAGVTLSPSTAVAGGPVAATTLYFIYAYWTGSAVALEASTGGYIMGGGVGGFNVKTADGTRTLVGMWLSAGAGAWSTMGLSWFNPKPKLYVGTIGNSSTTSTTNVEISTAMRINFCSFASRSVRVRIELDCYNASAANNAFNVGLDAINTQLVTQILSQVVGAYVHLSAENFLNVNEGSYHVVLGIFLTNAGTLYASNAWLSIEVFG